MNPVQSLRRWDVLAELRGKTPKGKDIIVFHRVVGFLPAPNGALQAVSVFRLTGDITFPEIMPSEDLDALLLDGRWVKSEFDPCVPPIRCSDDIAPKNLKEWLDLMHQRVELVGIVDRAGWDAFVPGTRAALIGKAAEIVGEGGKRHSRAWIRKLLYRFWKYGGSGFALLPGTIFNGSKSREQLCLIAKENGTAIQFRKKTGPKNGDQEAKPNHGPTIDPRLFQRAREELLEIVQDPDLRPTLARDFDRRRGIPWQLLTDKLNERVTPKTVTWNGPCGALENAAGVQLLTRRQVQSLGQSIIPVGDFVMIVKDWKQRALDHHIPMGDVRDVAVRPGQRYEVDILEADVFGIHDSTLLWIGRMFVAFVVDCFSRMIAAAYPWAGDPDVRMITYALAAAAMPKSEWGRIIDEPFTDDEWPCQGVPDTVVCDNGEAATHGGDHLAELVFDVVPNPPYLAYLKQAVETSFHLAHCGYINWLPASTKGPRERASSDPQKRAKVTLGLFAKEINRWACRVANYRLMVDYPEDAQLVREKVPLRPIDLWKFGCAQRGGVLRPYVRERHLPALLESKICRVVPEGIDLDGVYFDFSDETRPDWFARLKRAATAGPAPRIRVHFDRMTLNRSYLVPKDPKNPVQEIPLSRLSREWQNFSRQEYLAVKEFRKSQGYALQHEHSMRKVVFGQTVAEEIKGVDAAIKAKYGSLRNRAKEAAALGKDGQIASQMAADTARDQEMHPTSAQEKPSEPLLEHPTCRGSAAESYDVLLGLN